MRPSRPTAIRSKKNSCGDRHARRRRRTGGPESLRWFWSLTVNGPMRGSRGDLAAARSRKLDRRRRSADLHGLRQRLIFLRRLRADYSL